MLKIPLSLLEGMMCLKRMILYIYIYMEMTFPSNEQYQILFGTMLKQGHKI
jgi:hypothetical protein